MKALLLLNLAILVVNFVLSLGATEAQVHVMRTTARTAYAAPPRSPAAARAPAADARLVKHLARLPEFGRLTPDQLGAICGCLDDCAGQLAQAAGKLRRREAPGDIAGLSDRLRAAVERALREARVEEEELRKRLVHIVLSSTG